MCDEASEEGRAGKKHVDESTPHEPLMKLSLHVREGSLRGGISDLAYDSVS